WVRNDDSGVSIEVEGEPGKLTEFRRRLTDDKPLHAHIDTVNSEEILPGEITDRVFDIHESLYQNKEDFDAAIGPDTAICPDCINELFDPTNRRYRYAFTNCTNCGPRYTITQQLPYTRASTSMAGFAQCPPCYNEYTNDFDRRFHAEPNACHVCGPQLGLHDANGQTVAGDALSGTIIRLRRGEIIAIKGLGGFHLVCDARQPDVVARLRQRKQRDEKPLALMFANAVSVAKYADISPAEKRQLMASARPIVLLRKRAACDRAFSGIAPGLAWVGIMLPYTPLHYLLFHEAASRPVGTSWLEQAQDLVLVMTSANLGGEPIVSQNDEALQRLSNMADAYLLHDREITVRCDDSVLRVAEETRGIQLIRRARGYAPQAIRFAKPGPNVLALGGMLKNTLCLTRRQQAFVSQHIGDLDMASACLALEQAVEHMCHIFRVHPQAVAHDANPDFFSTRLAWQLAEKWDIPAIAVQHHHAHISAVLAEHRWEMPVLGLALDGVGLGEDGTAWGGELMKVSFGQYERIGHLRTLPLPGGDRAAQEPWRMAASVLYMLGREGEITRRFPAEPGAEQLAKILSGKSGAPPTSSLGRWFDAAAGLLGLQQRMSYEAQAAMRLESAAQSNTATLPLLKSHDIRLEQDGLLLDLLPLMRFISEETSPVRGAAIFHAELVLALANWVERAAQLSDIRVVACGGGCFLNAILSQGLRRELQKRNIAMLEARAVPPGDGGLSLGQAWVARARLGT
ncbi:MAG: carbamoyltransferase HypF, partial [Burkholderiaceae bacterium]|nr:carbamoyltransferase HypF [Burkholderiaceae bacterium]